ncbi:hypothetical protein PHYSODRAFT_303248 [Phytophthora sojae]|uniref:Uncharacterized protein n=1 Tax=Phytophthora sojae (strain P6497) TaxID=1094619 RepID=G4ZRQ1_PHYSP|nr:hypothetical protein PHYSODRAFT_303248 [Phytophthora sojae]EGZ13860.1 hypothetical protein PHYSODRAFT_303248 [Phytophthora sojae]|eukprot:XP_009531289.1 hypothetical protein PHYSODRAFT_303248 [Phytophthora sojae]
MSLLRWLLDNGATIDLSTATKVTMNPDYMEVMWWDSESVRVQLVLEAIRNESHSLVWWLLMRTRFEEKLSQSAISGAVDEAHASMKAWVLEHIEDDVCRWCFPRKRVATTSDDNALAKRAREK